MTQPAVLPDMVHITMPDGGAATVPKEDLAQAVKAGAHLQSQTEADSSSIGGLAGMAASALFGAGRAAVPFGLSDVIASEGVGLIGGEEARKTALDNMARLKAANPYSDMAGGLGGLVLGGVGAAGAKAESYVGSKVGEGLLGSVAGMGARGAVEGALIGAQAAVSEDVLADHALDGQKLFSSVAKDGLIGGVGGAALGAAGHYAGKVPGLFRGARGPTSDAVLDEIAGVEGAGRGLQSDVRASEDLIDGLRKGGATGEQAIAAEGQAAAAAEHAASGPLTGLVDAVAGAEAGAFTSKSDILAKGYATRVDRLHAGVDTLNKSAADMAKSGTRVLRNIEDTVNEVQFTQKSGQFAKLVDASRGNAQRDAVASLLQDVDETLVFWEGTAAKGGAEGSIKSLRRTWKDALDSMANVENEATSTMSRDLYIKTDNLKRALDKTLQWGKENRFGLPEAIKGVGPEAQYGLEPLANKFRSALESEEVWGQAGPAQARWNGAFSELKSRRDHFMGQLGESIDQTAGIRIPEVDFAKSRSFLNQLTGGDTDGMLQQVKSTEAIIDGMRNRTAAIREFGDLTPKQAAKLDEGLRDLAHFEETFKAARTEAGVVNRLKRQQEVEQGHGVGGLVGLVTDFVTRPATTMERLAGVRHTAAAVEKGIAAGFHKFFGGAKAEATAAPLRAKGVIAKEIGDIRELAGNPAALEAKAQQMVGDLSDHAPKTADEVKMTAKRAIYYLAKEAPIGGVSIGILGMHKAEPRYSDTQIAEWESKRNAVLGTGEKTAPEVLIADMHRGKLNREAIKAIEFVSPQLFAELQQTAQEQLMKMEQRGLLDKMPYQQKAAIASLLKVPADGTWRPDFIAMMQATKVPPAAAPAPAGGPAPLPVLARKANTPTADSWMTEASIIEQGAM